MDRLSQLSDELEEESGFLFAARGAAFLFFAGFFFLVPFLANSKSARDAEKL